jgi:hypothetical protein
MISPYLALGLFTTPDDPGNPCHTVEELCGGVACVLDIKTAKFKSAAGKPQTCCLDGLVPLCEDNGRGGRSG